MNRVGSAAPTTTTAAATTSTGLSATRLLGAVAIGFAVTELIAVTVILVAPEAVGVMTAVTVSVTVPEPPSLEAPRLALMHCEFRNRTCGRFAAFDARQRGANQTTMCGPAVVQLVILGSRFLFRHR